MVSLAEGFGDTENRALRALFVFGQKLYAFTFDTATGREVWRTDDGTSWEQVGPDGLGDSNNDSLFWDNSVVIFDGSLYIGTWNDAYGGELWQMLSWIYLPIVIR